ncbi:insulinase family protein [Anaerocolumna sedimenticola]|uniref:Insulinase family protein n=1 Tax=Anaerocolumna sedimenticola TaxID=2696063 RepID=A0A6P1TLN0_9FIRM|nr:insulinase family protein [Anaerocolumna sedimenticola]QHQ60816.1 insulinase family protein [Anaerocolumna sedimenticola]
MPRNLKSSKELGGLTAYELIIEEELKDINSLGLLLRHKKTGARIAVITNDDNNKVFSVGFRTPPFDSTGVPHIIEHSVLCGSKAFPAKDPFIELAKGSLNTFLNAITYPDKTIYPVASCNDKDFQNLMHVYMDAVFYPNIYKKEEIFRQEGWHFELEDEEAELKYNGVVYNEMKGAFSSPEQQLFRTIQNALYPDTSYGVESGGDPDFIPDLSYEQFLDFHSRYYHPSNSYIYLYGDMDVLEKLNWLDEEYLKDFGNEQIDSEIKYQTPFSERKEVEAVYPLSENEDCAYNTYLSYSLSIGTSLDRDLCMAFQILEYVLLSAPGAPLKQALLDAGIGKDIISSFDADTYQPIFTIIAKNAEAEQKEQFVTLIRATLEQLVLKGLDEKSLKAAINYYEFKYREADFGQFPKGLMYGLQMLASWLYDDNKPFLKLNSNKVFEVLKSKIGTDYYTKLITGYLLNNNHVALVTLKPQAGLTAIKEEQLKNKLAEFKAKLSKEEIKKIVDDTRHLKEYQDEPSSREDVEKIPLLSREDIGRSPLPINNEEKEIDGIPIIHHNVYTNGIAYLKLLFDLEDIPKALIPYVGLLSTVLGYIDTEHYSYLELSNEINIHTGGISSDVASFGKKGSSSEYLPTFQIDVKVLYEEMDNAFDLLKEIISFTKLDDEKRLLEIISEIKSRLQMHLNSSGHSAAVDRAMSYFSEASRFNEETRGIAYYKFIESLEADYQNRKNDLIDKMKLLMNYIFRKENLIISFTSNEEGLLTLSGKLLPFVEQLKTEPVEKVSEHFNLHCSNEGFKTSGQVQYVARTGNFFNAGYEYTGALDVLKVIMSYDYLWNNIRVKGGAYGCMCGFSSISGNGYFTSYRDPNLKETNEVYEKAVDYIRNFNADERDMTKYIIGTISGMDTPRTPRTQGNISMGAYLSGTTQEDIQKQRDEVLGVTQEDIRKLADIVKAILDCKNLCVIGNEKKIEQNKDLFFEVKTLIK